MTVSEGNSGSHLEMWKKFTNSAIKFITKKQNLAILLFGNKAKEFKECIHNFQTHRIIETMHPAYPYNGGSNSFYNSNCFQRVNEFLDITGQEKIDFSV